ncbi:hypothetical protein ABZ369_02865 [Streptomyces sp. NPDC005918]|uniref:hypothetical protein n=1 Tax=Streptomyces sp. NPDC005918 TaxID=3155454 RepID=UPI0033EFDD7D
MTTLPAAQALSAASSRTEYEAALQLLRDASRTYYGDGDSVLDDVSYDQLRRSVQAWEQEHPAEVSPDSPTGLGGRGGGPRRGGAAPPPPPSRGKAVF